MVGDDMHPGADIGAAVVGGGLDKKHVKKSLT